MWGVVYFEITKLVIENCPRDESLVGFRRVEDSHRTSENYFVPDDVAWKYIMCLK